MASLNMTSADAALKQLYLDGSFMKNLVYKNNPLLAMISKYENFVGRNMPVPLIYNNPQGRSVTFATAQANQTAAGLEDFLITRNHDYSIASVDNETLKASANDRGAFMQALTIQINGALNQATRSLAISMYRDGSGTIGNINATVTGTTLTLLNANDITNFEVNQKIQFSQLGTIATIRDSGEALTIVSVNRRAGSMVVSANLNTISGLTSGDFINIEGDLEGKIKGLTAWMPATVTSTSFFGVDRTLDSRLAGQYLDVSALPIEEGLIELANLIGREGGKPDWCFMNFANYSNLIKALGSKVMYIEEKVGDIGFRGVEILGANTVIKVFADQNCVPNDCFMLQSDTWKFYSLGAAPQIIDTDGNRILRESTADGVEVRTGYYGQLACSAPAFSGRGKLVA